MTCGPSCRANNQLEEKCARNVKLDEKGFVGVAVRREVT
jgi:hypothetical protein